MTVQEKQIITKAMSLPREVRALLAERLLESLDTDCFNVSDEWIQEIQNRCKAIDNGKEKLIPAEQVFMEAEQIVE